MKFHNLVTWQYDKSFEVSHECSNFFSDLEREQQFFDDRGHNDEFYSSLHLEKVFL